ncbi:hypothetical protein [Paraburkholderia sp. HD33-4]|uniref:hypothetical protein n=1 Tax=Paraburkholderia sp. HD33-4 TaxID=2883242 RepID=UPI001F392F75|nr:hypothetical protein [Paraburkholderia sp. HD33-4]
MPKPSKVWLAHLSAEEMSARLLALVANCLDDTIVADIKTTIQSVTLFRNRLFLDRANERLGIDVCLRERLAIKGV